MKSGLIVLAIIAIIALVFGASIVGSYNSMVQERNTVDTAWSQVETQYQRRFDLIPQLVGATKGYLAQEQKVFGDIAEARIHYAGAPSGSNEKVAATGQLEGALARLLVIVENYPQLQSNQTVQSLMDELTGTANRVNVAQQRYNESVQTYNTHIHSFPANLVAGFGGFQDKPLFKATSGAETAPPVNLEIK